MWHGTIARGLPWLAIALLVGLLGCRLTGGKPDPPPVLPDIAPTYHDYLDSDGFDSLFEASLVRQDPVIIVRTGRETADWEARLNAWIAAWNRGGSARGRTVRGQAGLPRVGLDGESIRELRLLVNDLLGRIDEAATTGSAWYRDQRERSRREALLKPYNLRFHKGEDGTLQLIFFHESYSSYYPRFLQKLMDSEAMPAGEWTRSVECSECQAKGERRTGRLMNRAE